MNGYANSYNCIIVLSSTNDGVNCIRERAPSVIHAKVADMKGNCT